LHIDKSGNGYALAATVEGLPAATSAMFEVKPGPATQLGFAAQPSDVMTDSVIRPPVVVAAFDAFGNPGADFTAAVRIALDRDASLLRSAKLGGTTTQAAQGGLARFSDLTIDQVGNGYTLRATADKLTDATSDPFSITPVTPPGGAVRLAFSDQPIPTQAGQVIPTVRVIAVDASNRPLTSWTGTVVISLGSNPGNGTLAGAKSYYVSSSD